MKRVLGLFGLGVLLAALGVFAAVALAGDGNDSDPAKIRICHAASAVNNPYQSNSVSKNSIVNADGSLDANGHGTHVGPVFPTAGWGDIIPPFPAGSKENSNGSIDSWGAFGGLNWTVDGQAIWENDCNVPEPPGDKPVTPIAPTFQDPTCEVGADVILPTVEGVTYAVKGTVAAGHKVSVQATADEGYVLVGAHEWEHTFGAVPDNCTTPPTEVTPAAPTFQDPTCDVGAAVNLPTVTGVVYKIEGTVAAGHEVTVEATAADGYVLKGTDEWNHTFGQVPSNCGPPSPHEVTGDASVSCVLPDGFYRVSGTVDGHAADTVSPATIPGTTKGSTEVTVTRGDTSVKTTVSTSGDCGTASAPPVVTAPPVAATPPPAQTTPSAPTAPLTPPKASPKPAAPPKGKPATTKPAKPTVEVAGAVAKEPPKLAYTP